MEFIGSMIRLLKLEYSSRIVFYLLSHWRRNYRRFTQEDYWNGYPWNNWAG